MTIILNLYDICITLTHKVLDFLNYIIILKQRIIDLFLIYYI